MSHNDELWDYLTGNNGRKIARPKPKYFWGDRAGRDMTGEQGAHHDDIPEEQFWHPEKKDKHE